MKRELWKSSLRLLTIAFSAVAALAAETAGTVKDSTVNVRGQASLKSEVITRLKKGEAVTILEEVAAKNPKPGDPAVWYKIAMPANTPVWIFNDFVDSNARTVIPKKLNVRSGPGENYSVVAVLQKGETVKEIRKVNDWLEIETPTNAFAFVAANLIQKNSDAASAETAAPLAATVATPEKAPETVTPPTQPAVTETQPETATATPKPVEIVEPAVATTPVDPTPKPVVETDAVPPTTAQPPVLENRSDKSEPIPAKRRIVKREGIVRRTVSIQSPTPFRLENATTGKTVNYLYAPEGEKQLKQFLGFRVQVTGEEVIDRRWPNTPLIEIQVIDLHQTALP
jgi:uncharacterized protein YgiM (DUF1202 family)